MPKVKTNRAAHKKFKVCASGRIKRAKAFRSHNTAKKTTKRCRQLRKLTEVSAADLKTVKLMLPNAQ